MDRWNHQGADCLRKGRVSSAEARYFTTLCTAGRKTGLERPDVAEGLINALRALQRAGDVDLQCATVMPDHLHLLFILGQRLSLSQTHGKLKATTKETLARSGLAWQENFHDHRLRQNHFFEGFARYIFLNPYRKGLIRCRESWPWWVLNRNYRPEFVSALEEGRHPPEAWLCSRSSAQELIVQDMAEEDPASHNH